jgi:hypothetical protein
MSIYDFFCDISQKKMVKIYNFVSEDGHTTVCLTYNPNEEYDNEVLYINNVKKNNASIIRYKDGGTTVISTVDYYVFTKGQMLFKPNNKHKLSTPKGDIIMMKIIN